MLTLKKAADYRSRSRGPAMSQNTRIWLRTAAQLALLATAINGGMATVYMLVESIRVTGQLTPLAPLGPSAYALPLLSVAAAVVAFWAAARERHRRISLGAAGALVLVLLVGASNLVLSTVASLPLLAWLAAGLAWSLGAVAMLAGSYRGAALGLDEPQALSPRSAWVWLVIAAPLVGVHAVIAWLGVPIYHHAAVVVSLVLSGLLYGATRRIRPIPGSASWVSVIGPLAALALPSYLLDLALAIWCPDDVVRSHALVAVVVSSVAAVPVVLAYRVHTRLNGANRP